MIAETDSDPDTLPVIKPRAAAAYDLANLDFLRTIAVGLVFVSHLARTMEVRLLGNIGHLGVLLFFVHTSLVLMMSMSRMNLAGSRLYIAFLVRRIFRIYPLSILAIVSAVAFSLPHTSWARNYVWDGWPALISNLFLTQNITRNPSTMSVLWSLPFEMQMYFVLPLLFLLLRRFPSIRAGIILWLAGVLIAAGEWAARGNGFDSEFLLTRYFPCFLAGVFTWRLMTIRTRHFSGASWVLLLLMLVISYRIVDVIRVYGPASFDILHGTLRNDHAIWWPRFFDMVRDWVFCAMAGAAIPFFNEIPSPWLKWISRHAALYSYGIYLAHIPVLWICFHEINVGSVAIRILLSIVLTLFLSVVFYHLLESPAIQLGKRLSTRLATTPVPG